MTRRWPGEAGRSVLIRLVRLGCLTTLMTAGAGALTQQRRILAFAPCSVIGPSQLTYVVAGGAARFFPLRIAEQGGGATVSAPRGALPRCPAGEVALEATVRSTSAPSDSAAAEGRARITLALAGRASLTTRSDTVAPQPRDLKSATTCVTAVRVESLSLEGGPVWLDNRWLEARLRRHLAGRACFDVTSLVYVYLTRGGHLQ